MGAIGDSVVVINEVHYHPREAAQDLEYVELHNQLSINVDMSGWKLDGGISFDFPEGTVIPKRGYLVVAKNPAALQAATGYSGALGPFTGVLSDGGERLRLYNNNGALRTRPEGGDGPAVETTAALWNLGEDDTGAAAGLAGNATTTGVSGGWPLTKSGAPVYSSTAATGSTLSMQFDGGTAVYSAASQVTATDNVGMECWVRPTTLGSLGFSFVLANGRVGNGGYGIVEVGGKWSIIHSNVQLSTPGPAVALNTWTFLRFIRQNGVSKLYVNGMDSGISMPSAPSAPNLFHIGANSVAPGFEGRFTGCIDGVRIFTLAAPPAEVQTPGKFNPSLDRRRVMDELEYSDSGAWPVAPDGSGFTLAKIDPQSGNAPANWAWSLQANGTPGAANFPAPPAVWSAALPAVTFNETGGSNDAMFRLELVNTGTAPVTLTGWQVVNGESGNVWTAPATTLAAGAYLSLDETTLGFRPADNDRLFLYTPAKAQLTGALRVAKTPRARETPGTGRWLRPSAPTFGAANIFALTNSVVLNEIFYHAFDDGPEQWIELKNRRAVPVDLGGWKLSEAVDYAFPAGTVLNAGQLLVIAKDSAALLAKYPGRRILGPWSGSLSNDGERILLEDSAGNPADEVTYGTGIRWPERADQGGSSLELTDANVDNSLPEAWAPSSTAALGSWQTITYRGVATDDGLGNDAFNDFLLGMLEAGEVLIDDVQVTEDPDGAKTPFIKNSTFESDTPGSVPAFWRCIGNHGQGRTVVMVDPDNTANKCLRVVATGTTDDKHNRLETTYFSGRSVVVGRTYQISLRARWMGGSNQLNTRLYFNYLQRTTLLDTGNHWGTPGLENSTAVLEAGPLVADLRHSPVVPAANAPVTISARLRASSGSPAVEVFYRVNSGAWSSVPATLGIDGRHTATLPGAPASALVQFYLRSRVNAGPYAYFPASADKGGCFFRVNDGAADSTGLRTNLRVLVTPENASQLFVSTNRMGNAMLPCTVIEDETTVYYQVMMRLHGSASGRYGGDGFGYHLEFNDDQPYRGIHGSVNIDRNGGYRELLAKQMLNRAGGGYWSEYNDIGKIMGPSVSGFGMISTARTSKQFVTGLFPGSGTGTLYNHELLYQPNGTVDGQPESLKVNNPYNHVRAIYDLADRGEDKEAYRWGWQIRSKRRGDDYTKMVRFNRSFGLTGAAFEKEIEAVIDVDQFMRTWAVMSLYGNDDQYGRLYEHNWRIYERPTDGRLIALPWDLDRAFLLATNASLTPTVNTNGSPQAIQRLFAVPRWKRLFDSHLADIAATTANANYLNAWAAHLGAASGVDLSPFASYVQARGSYALSQMPAAVPFEITSNGGADFSTAESSITLTGRAWVDVYYIQREGVATPLPVAWTGADTWSVSLPILPGLNVITLTGMDQRFVPHGTDTITITGTGSVVPASAANVVVSELHYHPADPSPAESAAGYTSDDFEFIELQNIDPAATADLTGVRFDAGITYAFPAGTRIAPGGRLVLPRRAAAFALRHLGVTTAPEYYLSTDPAGNQFSNGGEKITLLAADDRVIKSFTYDDSAPWPVEADGAGRTLTLISPFTNPEHGDPLSWRASFVADGTPGTGEGTGFVRSAVVDGDNNGLADVVDFALGGGALPTLRPESGGNVYLFTLERDTAAQAGFILESSTDLDGPDWQVETRAVLQSRVPLTGTLERITWRIPASPGGRLFVRCRIGAF